MLLSTLDLSHWTAIMWNITKDKKKELVRLAQVYAALNSLLDYDKKELEESIQNTWWCLGPTICLRIGILILPHFYQLSI
jgi:hypothetical protein